jgi:hypothetical protein
VEHGSARLPAVLRSVAADRESLLDGRGFCQGITSPQGFARSADRWPAKSEGQRRALSRTRGLHGGRLARCPPSRPCFRGEAPRPKVRPPRGRLARPECTRWVPGFSAGSPPAEAQRRLCDGQDCLRSHAEGAVSPRSRCRFPIRLRTRAIRRDRARTRASRGADRPRRNMEAARDRNQELGSGARPHDRGPPRVGRQGEGACTREKVGSHSVEGARGGRSPRPVSAQEQLLRRFRRSQGPECGRGLGGALAHQPFRRSMG